MQVSYNNQQFSGERVVHKKDPRSTFKYYQNPIITYHSPVSGPSVGGTAITIDGYGFKPFDETIDKKTGQPANRLFIRYLDFVTGEVIAAPKRISQDKYTNYRVHVESEPQPVGTKALFQISLNNEDWINVKAPGATHSFVYYESPHITAIQPSFGPLKSKANKKMTISGTNFVCQDPPCKDVKVRFGPPSSAIYEPGQLMDDGSIQCNIPMYTKPDVLPVQVTLNGFDYSNDNITFGFYDPYVIDAEPRLIATDGSTKVTVKGLGFVNSGETKVEYHTKPKGLKCPNNDCIKVAEFKDKNHIIAATLPKDELSYTDDGKKVEFGDPVYIEASVYNDDFTENRVPLYYYEEPQYESYSGETPANI